MTEKPTDLAALKLALDHICELRDAWQSGALESRDGKNGARSNRNVDVEFAIRAALSAQGAPQDWQPIATAPKDGSWIYVVSWHNRYRRAAIWFDGVWCDGDDGAVDIALFTHWMPLPAPPIA